MKRETINLVFKSRPPSLRDKIKLEVLKKENLQLKRELAKKNNQIELALLNLGNKIEVLATYIKHK